LPSLASEDSMGFAAGLTSPVALKLVTRFMPV
jgi:hypothetical protein